MMTRGIVAVALVAALGSPGCMPSAAGVDAVGPLPAGGHHVLFIGNSLTYVNDLPGTLSALATLGGDTIRTAEVAFPDFALEDHIANGAAAAAIAVGGWQYVVLQQGPSALPQDRQDLITQTQHFDTLVRAVGARTALYMVWPAQVNFYNFQAAIQSYALAAQAVGGLILPVSDAWLTAWAADSTLQFYASDGLHPSPLATYLAALVMYERITGKDARLLPTRVVVAGSTFGVADSTVRLLQGAAHSTNLRY